MDKDVVNEAVKETMETVMALGEANSLARIIIDHSARFDKILADLNKDPDNTFELCERTSQMCLGYLKSIDKKKTKEG